jgi:RNA polymerase sigma factor (sigma-70 family)
MTRHEDSEHSDLEPAANIDEARVGKSAGSVVPAQFRTGPEDWARLVGQIRHGDSDAMEQLYRVFSKGIRFLLCRQLGPIELDDKIHDIFLVVFQAICRGELREPERLMGFVRTVVRRQIANHIEKAVQMRHGFVDLDMALPVPDGRMDPEKSCAFSQKVALMEEVLSGISTRDREILTRFYLDEQSQESICSDMGLSENQFRLLKSRAKSRFAELGKKKLLRKSFSILVRAVGGSTD